MWVGKKHRGELKSHACGRMVPCGPTSINLLICQPVILCVCVSSNDFISIKVIHSYDSSVLFLCSPFLRQMVQFCFLIAMLLRTWYYTWDRDE